jgi:hypothetical protein
MALMFTPPDIVGPLLPDPLIERPSQTGDRIQQHKDVLAHLGQPLATIDDQLTQPNMAVNIHIQATRNHFARVTLRRMSVTSSGRSSINRTIRCTSG